MNQAFLNSYLKDNHFLFELQSHFQMDIFSNNQQNPDGGCNNIHKKDFVINQDNVLLTCNTDDDLHITFYSILSLFVIAKLESLYKQFD